MSSHEQPTIAVEIESEFSFEKWLEVELQKQYIEIAQALNEVGLLEIIPELGEKGIRGIDGNVYPIPTIEAIKDELLKDRKTYEMKMKQGFTKINLVPVALPIAKLIDVYKIQLLDHFKRGKLFYSRFQNKGPEPILPDMFNKSAPVVVSQDMTNADVEGRLNYFPHNIKGDFGKSKTELLAALAKTPFSGWMIELMEDNVHIPLRGKVIRKGGRLQFAAGESPRDYREDLASSRACEDEGGRIIDSAITQAIVDLHNKNQVISGEWVDDYGEWILSNSIPDSSHRVPGFGWSREGKCAFIRNYIPDARSRTTGFRPVVTVGLWNNDKFS